MNERWRKIEQWMNEALELPPAERTAFLESVCPDDEALRREVAALLAHHEPAQAWIGDLTASLFAPEPPAAPERIGPFRILREIGQGGMGTVYLAKRDDGQFEQRVALKVLRAGYDPEAARRFLAERQVLSRLEHPNIARLIDGGIAADGRPYFAMEYVEGISITEWCRRHGATLAERIALILSVGEAVSFAHRHLIVHRDLKPANILVTADGKVKLLDFGIAKLLAEETPLDTRTGVLALTPEYAAPEQLKGERITTSTDVYGLGCVLFELLAGARPVPATAKTWDALYRAVVEQEAPLASSLAPASLRRQIVGDLDTIAQKALEKSPERRYASIAAMIEDLRRHQQGLPIHARRNSLRYRTAKFAARHRYAVAASCIALIAIASAAVIFAVQSMRLAQENQKVERVSRLFIDMFQLADPNESRGATITARELLDAGAKQVEEELSGQPEVQRSLRRVLGDVYTRLGLYDRAASMLERALPQFPSGSAETADVLHLLGRARLEQGRYPQAAETLQRALAARPAGSVDAASTMTYLGLAHFRRNQYAEAAPLFARALAIYRQARVENTIGYSEALIGQGMVQYGKGAYGAALESLQSALAVQRAAMPSNHPRIADTLNNVASTLSRLGRHAEAEPLQQEALAILRRSLGDSHPKVAITLNNLGLMHFARAAMDEAEPLFRESLAIRRKALAAGHPDLAQVLSNLGLLLQQTGRLSESEAMLREALDIRRKAFGERHVNTVQSHNNLGQLYQAKGDRARAESHLRHALATVRELLGPEHPTIAISLNNLASLLAEQRRPEAGPLLEEALAMRRRLLPPNHPHVAHNLVGLGEWHLALGRKREARLCFEEACRIGAQKACAHLKELP